MLRRFILAVALVCAWTGVVQAQAVQRPPDCPISFSFTAPGSGVGIANINPYFDNRGSGCTIWTLSFQAYGFSADSLQFDASGDSNGVPSGFSAFANLFSGSLPLTGTTYGQISGFGYAPYVRVTLNSKTGTGRIYGTLNGWRNTSGDASSGTGCTVSNPCVTPISITCPPGYTHVQGAVAVTGATSSTIIAAPGVGLKTYIPSIQTGNTGSTTSLLTFTQGDGTGTKLGYTINPTTGGSNIPASGILVTSGNFTFDVVTGSASTTQYISAQGCTGP